MSDTIQGRLRRFAVGDSADNHTDPMEHVCTEAADEIDRLRAELDEAKERNRYQAAVIKGLDSELSEAKERIEELEAWDIGEECQEYDRAHGIYHITTEQINKAWKHRGTVYPTSATAALECLGIVVCKGCRGSGIQNDVYDLGKVIHEQSCAICNGNGWVMEER